MAVHSVSRDAVERSAILNRAAYLWQDRKASAAQVTNLRTALERVSKSIEEALIKDTSSMLNVI
jgi:hypothetical protein